MVLSWSCMIASLLQVLLRSLLPVMWGDRRTCAGENLPPNEAEHSSWLSLHATCGDLVKPPVAQQQNKQRQCNESTHRGLLQAPSKKPRRPFLPPCSLDRLCVLWLLVLHHMAGSILVASQGLFCNEVSQVLVAGTGSPGSANGVGSSASFSAPFGMSTSPDGSFVLIADNNNHKIRKLVCLVDW